MPFFPTLPGGVMHCVLCYANPPETGSFCSGCLSFLQGQREIELGLKPGKPLHKVRPLIFLGTCDFCRQKPCVCRCNICGRLNKDCTCSAAQILSYYGAN